ncbi:hypothetical protein [Halomonas sp. MS1]|nr:hypothetical protein [Halomonas sp. MS1]UTD55966.1 hypothetical protein NF683_01725 [Halomonas sp. MS1]
MAYQSRLKIITSEGGEQRLEALEPMSEKKAAIGATAFKAALEKVQSAEFANGLT